MSSAIVGVLLVYGMPVRSQQLLAKQPTQTTLDTTSFELRKTPVYFEVDLLVNPVYIAQFSRRFHVNGQPLDIGKAYRPKFYGTQPFQKAFSSINEIADQSNAAYASFYLVFMEKSKHSFFHHIRLIAGATHEKTGLLKGPGSLLFADK